MAEALEEEIGEAPMVLDTENLKLTDEQFFRFCIQNRDWRIERAPNGNILIMQPVGGSGSFGNATLTYLFMEWSLRDGTGRVFDSSGGFRLGEKATRSPDVSWVTNKKLKAIAEKDWEQFLPLCPDFVLELRSKSDRLSDLQLKMEEYMEFGARLGWLLDPFHKEVTIFRPGADPEKIENPKQLSGEQVLKGFTLDVRKLWSAMER